MRKYKVSGTGVDEKYRDMTFDNVDCDVESLLFDFTNNSKIGETIIIERVE